MRDEATSFSDPLAPYVGRWVAVLEQSPELVAGVGTTGPAALRAARRNRPKVRLTVKYVPDRSGRPLTLSPLLEQLQPIFAQVDQPLYLVGGAVRDALLGRVSHDLDFVLPEEGIRTAFKVGDLLGAPAYVLDRDRDTGRVVLDETSLDFVAYRSDDLAGDLYDRDLTINAIALPVGATTTAELVDPTGGEADLAAGWVRQVHADSLMNDPVRGLRAVRMAVKFGFALTPETEIGLQEALAELARPSAERIRDELMNLIAIDGSRALAKLDRLNVLHHVLPEIAALREIEQSPPHHENVLPHSLSVLRWLDVVLRRRVYGPFDEARPWAEPLADYLGRDVSGHLHGIDVLRLGALFHDVGKAQTQTWDEEKGKFRFFEHDQVGAELAQTRLAALKFSREVTDSVKKIVEGHMRPLLLAFDSDDPSPRALHRFFRAFGSSGLEIALLALADHLATYDGTGDLAQWERLVTVSNRIIEYYFTREAPSVKPKPLVDGNQLMSRLGLAPGPEIGRILGMLAEAQAAGEITTFEEGLALARTILD